MFRISGFDPKSVQVRTHRTTARGQPTCRRSPQGHFRGIPRCCPALHHSESHPFRAYMTVLRFHQLRSWPRTAQRQQRQRQIRQKDGGHVQSMQQLQSLELYARMSVMFQTFSGRVRPYNLHVRAWMGLWKRSCENVFSAGR